MTRAQKLKVKLRTFDYGLAFNVLILILIAAVMILPILYLVSTSLKPMDEMFVYPPKFFVKNPTLANFGSLFSSVSTSFVPFARYAFNSILSSVIVVVLIILLCSAAAYPLAVHDFPGRNLLFSLVVSGLMFAPEVLEIPRFIVISKLHIFDSYLALILPALAFPTGLFLMKQFLEQVPHAIFEAAKIDGAGELRLFYSMALPQIKPAWATVSILCFFQVWSDTAPSTLFISDEKLKTLTYYLSTISGTGVSTAGAAAAASFLIIVPPILIFIIFQKKIISTMAYSGIK